MNSTTQPRMTADQNISLKSCSILLLEDDALLRSQIATYLLRLDAEVTSAGTIQSAKQCLQSGTFDFALLDVNLPDGLGTDLLKENLIPSNTGVIVITAGGIVADAVEAMRLGAADYLVKPFDLRELPLAIHRARAQKRSARLDEHRRTISQCAQINFFFGHSLEELKSQLEKILSSDRRMQEGLPPVLIQGETGTGKTTIARWLHYQGPRAEQPLVEVNCSTLPEQLAESELFGHEKGAFTDARTAKIGLFEAANGGTLFLDELSSLPLTLQAKLLTAIEDKSIRRVSGNKSIPVNVRIIAATNRDLRELTTDGVFREDLYHRLDLFRVTIPPLRQRGGDVIYIAEQILAQLCRKHHLSTRRISHKGAERLRSYPWPGNVRELTHELERAIVFEETDELEFPRLSISFSVSSPASILSQQWFGEEFQFPENFSLEGAIYQTILHALKLSNNNVSAAARILGVPRDYVRYRLKTMGSDLEAGKHSPHAVSLGI